MSNILRQNLGEMVAARIKRLIIDESLKTGDRLPTEQEMAERFGVSRVSVREATKSLSFLGILRSAPRRGLTVGQVDMRRVTEYLSFHLALNDFPKAQLLEARIVIETGALSHVMARMAEDPMIYARLASLAAQLSCATDMDERIGVDIAFHRALLEASRIEPLVAFNDLLQIFFHDFRQSLVHGEWEKGAQQHQIVIDALREGNLPLADETLRKHIGIHRDRL